MSGMTLAERRAALEAAYADNQATQTSKTPVDVGGVSLAQRKEDLEAFHNAMQQFSKLSLDLDFDLQDRLSKFGSAEMQEEFQRAMQEALALKEKVGSETEATLAKIAAEHSAAQAAKRAQLAEVGGAIEALMAELASGPAPTTPQSVGQFDFGVAEAMAAIDMSMDMAHSSLEEASSAMASAQIADDCAASEERATAAEAEAAELREALDRQASEAAEQEAAARSAAQATFETARAAAMEQAQTQLQFMQGAFEQQLVAVQQSSAAAAEAAAAEATAERRVDPADGKEYTKKQFAEAYGGLEQWDAADPELLRQQAEQAATMERFGSAGWWASKKGRMVCDYVPSPQWVEYGAMAAAQNTEVYIRAKTNSDWWMVSIKGVKGTVPASMVDVLIDDGIYETMERLEQVNKFRAPVDAATSRPVVAGPYTGPVGVVLAGLLEKSSGGKKEKWGAEKKKKKKEDWKMRWFVLEAGEEPTLRYYKDQGDYLKRKEPKGGFPIRTGVASPATGAPATDFLIATRERNLKVRAASAASASDWIEQLNSVAEAARARDTRVF